MKTVSKKLLSLLLVAMLLVSAIPFQAMAAGNTVTVDIYEVDLENNAKLYKSVPNVDLDAYASTDEMVKAIYGSNYSKYNFKDFGDGTAMLQVWPVETPAGQQVFQLRLQHNNGTSDYTLVDVYEGSSILSAISNSGIKIFYEGHQFIGWSFGHTGMANTVVNYYHTADASMCKEGSNVIVLYADWTEVTDDTNDDDDVIYDVVLKIYTNGKTSSAAKTVSMDNYGIDGKITRDEVKLCVSKYFKGSNMTYYGLFTAETWNGGKYDAEDGAYSISLDPDAPNYIYVMVKNASAVGSGTADPSNPKTGDSVLPISMTMMALSGMAAAALYFANKKRRA